MNTKSFRFVLALLAGVLLNSFVSSAAPATQVVVQTVPLLAEWLTGPDSNAAENKIMDDWLAGRLGSRPAVSPSDYSIPSTYSWWAYGVGVNGFSTWAGTNGVGLFAGKPGYTAAVLVIVTGIDGDVSLNMLSTRCSSPQDSQINETQSFVGKGYAVTARGKRADGSIIDSGAGSQLVKTFAVVVYPQLYAAANETELQSIKSWIEVENAGNFQINMTATVAAAGTVLKEQVASLSTVPTTPVTVPDVTIVQDGTSTRVGVAAGGPSGKSYLVESAIALSSNGTVWTPEGYASQQIPLVINSSTSKFYRLRE